MTAYDQLGIKIVCQNKKARYNYTIEDNFEAGLVLQGTEVKSLRNGKANLVDSYATIPVSYTHLKLPTSDLV